MEHVTPESGLIEFIATRRFGPLAFVEVATGECVFAIAGGGGGSPEVPEMTPEEQKLQSIQTEAAQFQLDQAKQQQADYQALSPILLQEAGLTRTVDPTTGAVSFAHSDPNYQMGQQIQTLENQRTLDALNGTLPITETLKNELKFGQDALNQRMTQQLGPGWQTSTAGIQAQAEFDRMGTALKEAQQHDQLNTAQTLALNRQGAQYSTAPTQMQTLSGPAASTAQLFAGSSGSAGQALQLPMALRNYGLQQYGMAGQERAGYASAGLGMAGMMGAAAIMSDPKAKTNIKRAPDAKALAAVRDIPISTWNYKGDPTPHVGGMAPDFPKAVSPTGKTVDVVNAIGMLTGAVRALDQKVNAKKGTKTGRKDASPARALLRAA